METRSPWSTPTQSEIGEAESQLKYLTDVNVKLRADSKLMIREMGDGEPAEAIFMEGPRGSFDDSISDGHLGDEKRRVRNPSKSPKRKASLSPTKGKLDDPSKLKGRGRLTKQQSFPQQDPPSPTKSRSKSQRPAVNGSDPKSGTSTARTDRSDATFSSNSSGNAAPDSPTKSPTKRGAKSKARDVLQLPKPYNAIKSDTVKRWNSHLEKGTSLAGDEKDYQMFKMVEFTHALILKVNQLSKQGLLDRKTCFRFVCNVARYVIPDQDFNKCMTSFYSYARELTNVRENIKTQEQKADFDSEVKQLADIFCPNDVIDNLRVYLYKAFSLDSTYVSQDILSSTLTETLDSFQAKVKLLTNFQPYVEQTIAARPITSKPRDPDSYDFGDEQLAKDYRKMYEKYHQMEALLKQKKANEDNNQDD